MFINYWFMPMFLIIFLCQIVVFHTFSVNKGTQKTILTILPPKAAPTSRDPNAVNRVLAVEPFNPARHHSISRGRPPRPQALLLRGSLMSGGYRRVERMESWVLTARNLVMRKLGKILILWIIFEESFDRFSFHIDF